ncbi:MAG: hypothetical protein KJO77_04055 [Bacteroidia bacterium]|nr:hypothetical protein [Bacteroidia bacterium]
MKRFYLIGILFIALAIPFITINQYVEMAPESSPVVMTVIGESNSDTSLINFKVVLLSIYGIGFSISLIKFIINLLAIRSRIRHNLKLKEDNIIQVLVNKTIAPHTFFNYIFFNKYKFETNQIPAEVKIHEQTHAQQKHSLDVLFIEFVQVIFWFHPLIMMLKKDIKLNHEFLADQAVLRNNSDPATYQNTLLAFSTNEYSSPLVNAINYSLIKKRFKVMKRTSSKKVTWFRSLLLLPLSALLLVSFASRSIIEIEPADQEAIYETAIQKEASKEEVSEYNRLAKKYNNMSKDEMVVEKQDMERLKYLYDKMSKSQRLTAESFPVIPPPPAPKALAADKPDLPPPPPPLPDNATKEATKKYKAQKLKKMEQKEAKLATVKADQTKSKLEKERAVLAKEKHAYAAEMKKNKAKLKEEKLRYAEERKAVNKERKGIHKAKKQELTELKRRHAEERKAVLAEAKNARIAAIKEESELRRTKLQEKRAVLAEIKEVKSAESNTAHVKRMTEKNAIFFYEGKKVASKKALKLAQENPNLHIQTRLGHDKTPKVYISKKPIVVKEND